MKQSVTRDISTLGLAVLLALVALLFASNLKVTSDNRVFYHDNNPRFVELTEVENEFELYSNVSFLIVTDTKLSTATADAIVWLSNEVETYRGYVRHSSLDSYPHLERTAESIDVSTILSSACVAGLECGDILDSTKYPEVSHLVGRLISRDSRAFATSVSVDIEIGNIEALNGLTRQIERTVLNFEKNFPDLQIAHTGAIPMMQAFADASNRDLSKLFPISAALMLVASAFLFGSIRFALAAMCCAILNVIWIMGLASFFNLAINSATSTLPLALLVISVSASAHLVCYVSFRISEAEPNNFRALVTQACNANKSPILMASLTTCVGLATLSFVEIPPFREFGLLAALGTITNYFIVILILPAALRLLPPGKIRPRTRSFVALINNYARFVDSGKLPINWVILLVTIAIFGLSKFEIDEDYIKYFDDTHEFRIGADLLSEKLASPYNIDVVVDFGEGNSALESTNLNLLKVFQSRINSEPLVVNSFSIIQQLELANLAFGEENNEPGENYVQQLFLAFELSLPPGHSTNTLITQSHQKTRISILLGNASSSALVALEERIKKVWANTKGDSGDHFSLVVTGETLPLAHLSKESLTEVLTSVLVCITFLWIGVLIATKNLLLSSISVAAILGPLAIAFVSWAWVDSEFGLATAIVIAVTIGIIVDDAIHFIHRFQFGKNNHDLTTASAITYAIHHSAAGIVASSVILVAGFSILCLSSFAVNEQFGIGVSLTIASAFALTLVVLPSVLMKFKARLN